MYIVGSENYILGVQLYGKSFKKPKKDSEFHMQDAKITSGSSWLHTKECGKHYMVRKPKKHIVYGKIWPNLKNYELQYILLLRITLFSLEAHKLHMYI